MNHSSYYLYRLPCHGCDGKGWVETSKGEAVLCPVCLGAGTGVADQPIPMPIIYPSYPSPYPDTGEPTWMGSKTHWKITYSDGTEETN